MVRRKKDRLAFFLAILALALALAALTFYLWHLTEMTRLGYETARLEEEINRMKEDVGKLETKKAALLALDRVERIAREKLQMTDPRPEQVRYQGSDEPKEKAKRTRTLR